MLNRYPEQSAARKGFAITGCAFLMFGLVMAWIEQPFGAGLGVIVGSILAVPAVFFSRDAFSKTEKLLSTITAGW
jgi:hypothetical protein